MNFVQVWFSGLINPSRAFEELKNKPAPMWGFLAVLIRFVVTSLTTTLALHLLGREPFYPSSLTFLPTESYYAILIFILPLFGIAAWLLMSGVAHLILRLAGRASDFDQALNVVGMGMVIPMPVVWLWDWTMIGLNAYKLPMMAASHAVFQAWETGIETVGLKRVLGLRASFALGVAVVVNLVYILLGTIFAR